MELRSEPRGRPFALDSPIDDRDGIRPSMAGLEAPGEAVLRGPRHLDVDRLYRLVDVGRNLMATLDFEEILGRVVEVAQEVTGARYGALGVYDERRRELSRFITRGIDDATAEMIGELPRGHGVLGELLTNPVPCASRTSARIRARTASRSTTRR